MSPPSLPTTMKCWTVIGHDRFSFAAPQQQSQGFSSLVYHSAAPLPLPLGDTEVLVRISHVSLNYRDVVIPQGTYPSGNRDNVVPCSDGAGTVAAIGERVTRWRVGDRVCTLFNQSHLAGPLTAEARKTGLGNSIDGCLREYGRWGEEGLVPCPENLSFRESCTLVCAGVTAWNALFGLEGRALKPGDTVLVEGTGGVSLFALQFAKACGARVIATTSSSAKSNALLNLGADHVLNYHTNPSWGSAAKALTPHNSGVKHVLEVGGPATMAQALAAIAPEGVISIIGYLSGTGNDAAGASFLDCLEQDCTVRGILVGSRMLFEQVVEAVEVGGIRPVVDEREWGIEEAVEAMQWMANGKNFGKVTIKVTG